jgi:hypothetical protein
MQQYFQCHRCGAHNLVGAAICSHCHQQLFYNCPHCRAWVDNRHSHCPQCRKALNWPKTGAPQNTYGQTWYVPQRSYVEERKGNSLPAVLVSLFVVGVIALIFINPGSSSATKYDATAANNNSLQTAKTSMSPSGSQPQITLSSPGVTTQSADTSTAAPAPYTPANVTLNTSSSQTEEINIIPTLNTSTVGTGYTPKRSAYLQQQWPTWGHCTKGSCQGYTQQ